MLLLEAKKKKKFVCYFVRHLSTAREVGFAVNILYGF